MRTPIETRGKDLTTLAEFAVGEGEQVPFVLTWFASHKNPPRAIHYEHALRDTERYWRSWSKQFQSQGKWRDAVMRSLIVLKGLTYAPTGGLVAAATTSLPEQIGGPRNWDYRYCWLRDCHIHLALAFAPRLSTRKPKPGGNGCCELSLGVPHKCRSCTAFGANVGLMKRNPLAFRLRKVCAGAHRQRCFEPISARCVWRGTSDDVRSRSRWNQNGGA